MLVNFFLFATAYFGLRSRPWTPYATMGWGLGLALHGISVFVLGTDGSLRERMVQKERERLQRERGGGPPR
ncbi:2TM domain-containing protein [Polaromonas sp.]|uniref:2TM domain-containing protein n=1 Tax=Polaromonas sp. TaxID=1869339 RepID=UPI003263429A